MACSWLYLLVMCLNAESTRVNLWPMEAHVVDDFLTENEALQLAKVLDVYTSENEAVRGGEHPYRFQVHGSFAAPLALKIEHSLLATVSTRLNRYVRQNLRVQTALPGLNCSPAQLVPDTPGSEYALESGQIGIEGAPEKLGPQAHRWGSLRRYIPEPIQQGYASLSPHTDVFGSQRIPNRCLAAVLHLDRITAPPFQQTVANGGSTVTRDGHDGALQMLGCLDRVSNGPSGNENINEEKVVNRKVRARCVQRIARCALRHLQRRYRLGPTENVEVGDIWNCTFGRGGLFIREEVLPRPRRLVLFLAESPHAVTSIRTPRAVFQMWWRGAGAWAQL